jgi:CcmD family protein
MFQLESLLAVLGHLQQNSDPNRFNEYLVLGYAAMWLVAVVYIASLANRQRNVREELKLLRRLLKEDEESQDR